MHHRVFQGNPLPQRPHAVAATHITGNVVLQQELNRRSRHEANRQFLVIHTLKENKGRTRVSRKTVNLGQVAEEYCNATYADNRICSPAEHLRVLHLQCRVLANHPASPGTAHIVFQVEYMGAAGLPYLPRMKPRGLSNSGMTWNLMIPSTSGAYFLLAANTPCKAPVRELKQQ